jgi:predicted ATPase
MQIQIRNFAPIKAFDLDLKKDFVVIFGKNNMGKSYAISVVYLVLKHLLDMEADSITQKEMETDLKKLFSGKREKISAEEISEIFAPVVDNFRESLEESFYNTFDLLDKIMSRFSTEKPSVTVMKNRGELTLEVQKQRLVLKKFLPITDTIAEVDKYQREHLEPVLGKPLFFLYDEYIGQAKKETSLIFFPASRSGLYQGLNAFSQIMVELSKSRRFLTKKLELPSISEPVSDYFLSLSLMQTRKPNKDNAILSIVNEIEQTVIKGEVIFDEVSKKIFYKPQQTDLVLDVSLTSSMVSELSPIVCYLKYVVAFADSKSIIFIEEPEAHLHPETQVLLMEIFAKLIKANVKIIMTSHSDYMFNKMNNLILEGQLDIASLQAIVFKETSNGDTIAKEMPTDSLGVDDEIFLEIAEKLFHEKLELVEKLNDESS